ncbi:hypothetical protein EBR37_02715 [bacterium]|nr:hypothetical protein [bacterium]
MSIDVFDREVLINLLKKDKSSNLLNHKIALPHNKYLTTKKTIESSINEIISSIRSNSKLIADGLHQTKSSPLKFLLWILKNDETRTTYLQLIKLLIIVKYYTQLEDKGDIIEEDFIEYESIEYEIY